MERETVEGSLSVADVALQSRGGWVKRGGWRKSLDPGPLDAGPWGHNCNLIEGYRGDPAVTERRTEVVIEEGVPLSLSLFPARELCRLEQYWCWRGAAASIA